MPVGVIDRIAGESCRERWYISIRKVRGPCWASTVEVCCALSGISGCSTPHILAEGEPASRGSPSNSARSPGAAVSRLLLAGGHVSFGLPVCKRPSSLQIAARDVCRGNPERSRVICCFVKGSWALALGVGHADIECDLRFCRRLLGSCARVGSEACVPRRPCSERRRVGGSKIGDRAAAMSFAVPLLAPAICNCTACACCV